MDLSEQLDRLRHDRDDVQTMIVDASRASGTGALMLIGSLGRGGGDSFSDLDIIAVPGPNAEPVNLAAVFSGRVLSILDKPCNAPAGGSYTGLCIAVSGLPLWVDLYVWPAATAAVPTDGVVIYDDLGIPASDLAFISLMERHPTLDAPVNADAEADLLLRVAVAAKYLARADLAGLIRQMPEADWIPLSAIAPLLRNHLREVQRSDLTGAVAATASLIDLAEAQVLS